MRPVGRYEVSVEHGLNIVDPLPVFSSDTSCPAVARDCIDVLHAQLSVVIR